MTKSAITRLFVGSLTAMAAGLVLLFVAGLLGVASSSFVMSGPDVVGIQATPFAWSIVAVASVAVIVIVGGGIGQLVAWIGAVLNTARLADKTWFMAVFLLGLLSFGFVATIAYVIAGPDGTQPASDRRSVSMQHLATH